MNACKWLVNILNQKESQASATPDEVSSAVPNEEKTAMNNIQKGINEGKENLGKC